MVSTSRGIGAKMKAQKYILISLFCLMIYGQNCGRAKFAEKSGVSLSSASAASLSDPDGNFNDVPGEPLCTQVENSNLEKASFLDQIANEPVTICHVPPGDPANRHNITIDMSALNTHINHHDDYIGDCSAPPERTCVK